MSAFMCPVVAQEKLPVGHALLSTTRRFTVSKQPFEQRQVQGLQPFAFVDAPVLVAAFQEIPSVERSDSHELSGISGVEPFAWRELHTSVGFLQLRDVKPELVGIHLDPFGVR
jgi:hypothetical protein